MLAPGQVVNDKVKKHKKKLVQIKASSLTPQHKAFRTVAAHPLAC